MNKPDSLSDAQWRIISYAYRSGDGGVKDRINVSGVHSKTLTILHDKGLIDAGSYIRDDEERASLQNRMKILIGDAKDCLEKDYWEEALMMLERARDCKQALERQAWWLTETAIELIEQRQ